MFGKGYLVRYKRIMGFILLLYFNAFANDWLLKCSPEEIKKVGGLNSQLSHIDSSKNTN
jgi:hypothetical protein